MVKPFRENASGGKVEALCESAHNTQSSLGSQVTCWDGNKREQQRLAAPPAQHLPSDRAHFPGRTSQSGPRLQNSRGPQPNRTKGPSYGHSNSATQQGSTGGPVTMVTATASVTVAVHPTLPGAAYQGYMHEGFDTDSELDCFDAAKRTCDKTNYSSCKRDSLELQDLETTQGPAELGKTQGELSFAPDFSLNKKTWRQAVSFCSFLLLICLCVLCAAGGPQIQASKDC